MYCPNCSAPNSTDQSFCRSCGMNLEQTAISFRDHSTDVIEKRQREEKRLERFGKVAFGGLGVVAVLAVCGILYYVLTKMVLTGTQPWAGVVFFLVIVFASLSLAYVIWRQSMREKWAKVQKQRSADINQPIMTTQLLGDPIEPPASVIERTTELLEIKKR